MLEITTAIFLTLMGSAAYHLLPVGWLRLRIWFVAALSFLIIFAHYPLAAVFATVAGMLAWLLYLLGQRASRLQKYAPFTLIGLLLVFGYEDFEVATSTFGKTLVQFGMSFYILRLYLALRTAAARRERVEIEEFLVIALFFPIFPAGPICAQEAFSRSPALSRSLLQNYLLGFMRIGIGIFALYFVTGVVSDLAAPLIIYSGYLIDWSAMGAGATYLAMLLDFLEVYANFVGYTEIAIGLGLFFGFSIPENFRYPFLALNIRDFWQRWHLSLSKFITGHIYMPLMLSLRKPRLSIFLAFAMVGMWHKMNPQYMIWGVGHGAMLAAYMTVSGSPAFAAIVARVNPQVWKAMSWLLTISLVAFFSAFANQHNMAQSIAFTESLVSGW